MKIKLLIILMFTIPLVANGIVIDTEHGQFRSCECVSFSGTLYSPTPQHGHYAQFIFSGIINEGDTILLDLADGDSMMRSIFEKAVYTRWAIAYVLNEHLDVDSPEYADTIDYTHYSFCYRDITDLFTLTRFNLKNGQYVEIEYLNVKGIFFFAPYINVKKHYSLSIEYLQLDSLLYNADVCVTFAPLSYSKCDNQVFYQ